MYPNHGYYIKLQMLINLEHNGFLGWDDFDLWLAGNAGVENIDGFG